MIKQNSGFKALIVIWKHKKNIIRWNEVEAELNVKHSVEVT